MPDLYTITDLNHALGDAFGAVGEAIGRYPYRFQWDRQSPTALDIREHVDIGVKAALDYLAPLIAAKALREAANDMWLVSHPANDDRADGFDTAKRLLLQRAEGIEGKA